MQVGVDVKCMHINLVGVAAFAPFSLAMDYTCVYIHCTQRIRSAMQCICLVVVRVLYVVLVPLEQNLFIFFVT